MMPSAIALFGGTFDPVHFGHLRAALEAQEQLGLEDFRLLPAGDPPHREPPRANAAHRLAMLQLATREAGQLGIDDREIRRAGPSYMVDTLQEIRSEAGDVPLILCVGQDAANELDSWHEWRRLFELAHLVVMRRPDAHGDYRGELGEQMQRRSAGGVAELAGTPCGRVLPLAITQLEISATVIRQLFASGRSPGFLLPDSVVAYIRRNRLY